MGEKETGAEAKAAFLTKLGKLFWQEFSPLQKIEFGLLILGYGGAVWWISNYKHSADLVKHEAELTKRDATAELLKAEHSYKLAEARWAAGSGSEVHSSNDCSSTPGMPDLAKLPKYEDATLFKMSMVEFESTLADWVLDKEVWTDLQSQEFFSRFVGGRFEWTGYVESVVAIGPMIRLNIDHGGSFEVQKLNTDGQPIATASVSARRTCFFSRDKYLKQLAALDRFQTVTVSGVLTENGSLARCRIVESDKKASMRFLPTCGAGFPFYSVERRTADESPPPAPPKDGSAPSPPAEKAPAPPKEADTANSENDIKA